MLRKYSAYLFLLSLLLTHGSCIYERVQDCPPSGVYLQFSYLHHHVGENIFGQEVEKITVLVFDEHGLYLSTHTNSNIPLTNDYKMHLPLEPGKYSFVAWGGSLDQYQMSDVSAPNGNGLVKGVTTLSDFRLILEENQNSLSATHTTRSNAEEITVRHLQNLYHGLKPDFVVEAYTVGHTIIPLVKDNNTIRVVVTGLEYLDAWLGTAQTEVGNPPLDILLTSNDGVYMYDNTLDKNYFNVRYQYDSSEITNNLTMNTLTKILRLTLTGDLHLKIISTSTQNILFDDDALALILRNPKYITQEDLDLDDEFEFIYTLNADLTMTVKVNRWIVIDAIPLI